MRISEEAKSSIDWADLEIVAKFLKISSERIIFLVMY